MKLKLPKKKPFNAALKLNRWPVNWFDDKKEKERKRQEKISKLYPKNENRI
jgi:hypothetical protein|tara:strand:+ start:257 stop:409 length:153 start_codon:yes stop_codon:yes gene_type:complete